MKTKHVDCSDTFNTSQVFATEDDVLQWARSFAYEIGFVAVIMRSNTNTGMRGRTSFVLIGCERSGQYRSRKKYFVRRDTGSRKCGRPFKLHGKPVVGGQGWMVKLMSQVVPCVVKLMRQANASPLKKTLKKFISWGISKGKGTLKEGF
ncbi:uncharacterized protein LOC114386128 [Glycine soja]|uniref:uncharacterized protein LOC114386128 n=1 Tax=Glycine soja TaxID=3848 RepID=UPI00103FB57E|nr:uncharacterized protein LOC114386128 [Glycine soja]